MPENIESGFSRSSRIGISNDSKKKYRKPAVFVVVVVVSFRTICIKMDGFFFWCNKVPTLYSGRLALAVRNN